MNDLTQLAQEMTARIQEMRAQVVQAEAEVPLALAGAFRAGHLVVRRVGQERSRR